jgi:hypothetical protein
MLNYFKITRQRISTRAEAELYSNHLIKTLPMIFMAVCSVRGISGVLYAVCGDASWTICRGYKTIHKAGTCCCGEGGERKAERCVEREGQQRRGTGEAHI